ncbi:MAG: hypothetical protein ACPGXK_06325 [Phycisphaerae bacterium]
MTQNDPSSQSKNQISDSPLQPSVSQEETDESRRALIRKGVKLAFVSPVITSFLASQARAAGSNLSCYPTGQPCGDEACCNGPCNLGVCP